MSTGRTTGKRKGLVMTSEGRLPSATPPTPEANLLRADVSAGVLIAAYSKAAGNLDPSAIVAALEQNIRSVSTSDLGKVEGMLLGQAYALHAVFLGLAGRASGREDSRQWEPLMRIALKAQNQSRLTFETAVAVKNPSVVIARNANGVNGNQQVNQLPHDGRPE